MDRMLLQPAPPPLVLRDAQSRRLRDHQRGMINTINPSGTTGQPHGTLTSRGSWVRAPQRPPKVLVNGFSDARRLAAFRATKNPCKKSRVLSAAHVRHRD